ncbi:MAG: iron-containing alcohol dehydrogenase [Actinomycetaceae bacterium]|nr:iron-containing alcohol dehydrogenase [Actinomycetaceae bacterium]
MTFSFKTAKEIVFGDGAAAKLPEFVEAFGSRAFLVLDPYLDESRPPVAGIAPEIQTIRSGGEPTVEGIRTAMRHARAFAPDVVVGIGGGSTMDTAKAIGILLCNDGDVLDYLEVVGNGQPLVANSVPVIAVPTTAGTGAEVTANTPIYSPEHQVKASLRSPAMVPAIALVDPVLTVTTPASVTASSGLDALTQCLEPYTSRFANDFTDLFALEGLRRAARGLRAAYADGSDMAARTDMAMCSLLGGLSLANAKLGAVHGLAAPLGGMIGAAHGEICAALLAVATEVNVAAMQAREPDNPALARYRDAAQILTGDPQAGVDDGVAWIRETVNMLGVRSLSQLGLTQERISEAADKGMVASSMKGNPIVLTHTEVTEIVTRSM